MDKNILSPEEVEALLKKTAPKCSQDPAELNENLTLHIELGQLEIPFSKFMKLEKGEDLVLDTKVNTPLNISLNGRVVAKGQLKIIHRKLAISLTDLVHKSC